MRSTPTMIAKIAKGADFHGVLCYNYDKVARGEAEVVGGQGLPIRAEGGYDFHACLRRLEDLAAAGPRVRTPVLHCSLNPHPDDALTDAQMRAIAADYMRRMGYGDQPYLLFRHTDTGRTHYHIVSLRVDARGRKIADGNDLYRSRRATDELERAYGLHPKRAPGEAQGARQAAGAGERAGHAAHIRARVGEALGAYACQSLGELNALLEPMGIRARETRRQKGGRSAASPTPASTRGGRPPRRRSSRARWAGDSGTPRCSGTSRSPGGASRRTHPGCRTPSPGRWPRPPGAWRPTGRRCGGRGWSWSPGPTRRAASTGRPTSTARTASRSTARGWGGRSRRQR